MCCCIAWFIMQIFLIASLIICVWVMFSICRTRHSGFKTCFWVLSYVCHVHFFNDLFILYCCISIIIWLFFMCCVVLIGLVYFHYMFPYPFLYCTLLCCPVYSPYMFPYCPFLCCPHLFLILCCALLCFVYWPHLCSLL